MSETAKLLADPNLTRRQKAAREADRLARAVERERNRDTRRKIITGGLLIEWAERDQRASNFLQEVLARISREHDHKPFEGWTVPRPEGS